ncbi:hypothetical protein LNP74_05090 [Klebsiella pneumoniae subsp. pneumoniae]|nr:hypothetical protein [Klebsiella pneumoniae subsp. pneumoniae]
MPFAPALCHPARHRRLRRQTCRVGEPRAVACSEHFISERELPGPLLV